MFQSRKLTTSPKRIGKKVKLRKSRRLGPRKKSAQSQSRLARRRVPTRWRARQEGDSQNSLANQARYVPVLFRNRFTKPEALVVAGTQEVAP